MTPSLDFRHIMFAALVILALSLHVSEGFIPPRSFDASIFSIANSVGSGAFTASGRSSGMKFLMSTDDLGRGSSSDGVIELAGDEDGIEDSKPVATKAVSPFLSQGDISEDALNPDLSDPKQTRVILYIIISLVPVLFLVPLMLGNRDFIPVDQLPPVTM